MNDDNYVVYIDGGSSGNPGESAIGGVIIFPDGKKETYSHKIGYATNNYAEYSALIAGLTRAHELGGTEVECVLDSELITNQMKGLYKIKEPTLQKLFVQAYNAATKFKKVTYRHILRENNKEADRLVNETLDKQTILK